MLYAGVGALVLFYVYERSRVWVIGVSGVIGCWVAISIGAHAGLVREYVENQPRNVRRELASYLLDHGIRHARSDYWTAYSTTFLADERVIVASTDTVRVDEYRRLAAAHDREAVTLCENPAPEGRRRFQGSTGSAGRARL
jgi:hypothetical protein